MNELEVFLEGSDQWRIDNEINIEDKRNKDGKWYEIYSYQDFREIMNIICNVTFKICYIYFGTLQFLATKAAFIKMFHHDNLMVTLISFILGFFPFIGTFFGICGAHISFGLTLSNSLIIFILPYFISNGPMFLIIIYDINKDFKRWKAEEKMTKYADMELKFQPEAAN